MVLPMAMRFVFPVPSSVLVNSMSVISILLLPLLGLSETRGMHLQYSKFWNSDSWKSSAKIIKVSSRTGMILLYAPAFLAGCLSFLFFDNLDSRILLLKSALTLHFFKRLVEVNFIHKYSTKMVIDSAILISLSYFSSTATMIYTQHLSKDLPHPSIDLKYTGLALFFLGLIGNFYHHYLLSKTRKKDEYDYKIPEGGLFGVVICPHYLFEIILFFGISLISQTVYSFCFSIGTAFYLCGRSYATRRWYISKFEDFPPHRKALVPFVF